MPVFRIHPSTDVSFLPTMDCFFDTCTLLMMVSRGTPEATFLNKILAKNEGYSYVAQSHMLEYPHVLRKIYYTLEAENLKIATERNASIKQLSESVLGVDPSAENRVSTNVQYQITNISDLVVVMPTNMDFSHATEIAEIQKRNPQMESHDASCLITMRECGVLNIFSQDGGFQTTEANIFVIDRYAKPLKENFSFD